MIFALVFLSGAAALVYEVAWARQLATFLGVTSYAHTVTVATFMAGLALGAAVVGRRADGRARPLRLFAWLEAGIAGWALLSLALPAALESLYVLAVAGRDLSPAADLGVRFALALAALLVPAFLMGGTLPVLVRGLARRGRPTTTIAWVYGANTLGAAAGAFAAGYLLIPGLGVRGSVIAAAAADALVALFFLVGWVGRESRRRTAPAAAAPPPVVRRVRRRPLLIGFALSGAAALAAQLAWMRALGLVLGSSVYAFSSVLATYLAGIAAGSLIWRRLARRSGGAGLRAAAGLEVVAGFAVVLGLPLILRLPELFLLAYRQGVQRDFVLLQLLAAALAAAVMLVPTLAMGALFPLLAGLAAPRAERLGAGVGAAYAANSLGTVAGTVLAGLALLPALGVKGTLVLAGAVHVAVGCLFWQLRPATGHRARWQALATLVGFVVVAALLPPWDRVVMNSGPFINAARILDGLEQGEEFRDWLRSRNRLLFYAEGADATVTVRDFGEERLLVINGKTDGSRLGDRKTQAAVAHVPLLLHPAPAEVLVIGFGTGITPGSVASHPVVRRLDVVEIAPEVIAASRFFQIDNGGVLFDPRLRLATTDARSYLLTRERRWDAIVSEPSNPWTSGSASLFTREFFEIARSRLAAGGVMAHWVHTYGMSEADLRSVVGTFEWSFPGASVWMPQLGDLVLLGGLEPRSMALDLERLEALLRSPRGAVDLAAAGLDQPAAFARMLLLGPGRAADFAAGARINTDDRPHLEFSAPRNLYSETTLGNTLRLIEPVAGWPQRVPATGLVRRHADGAVTALGLRLRPPAGAEPRVDWTVTWSVSRAVAGAAAVPLVSTRRALVWSGAGASVEIDRAERAALPDAAELVEHLATLLPAASGGSGVIDLADGTLAVWSEGSDGAVAGLAWGCGRSAGDAAVYAAVLTLAAGAEPGAALSRTAAALECAREDRIAPQSTSEQDDKETP